MTYTAIILFVLTAGVGGYMAARHFRGRPIPMSAPAAHGLLAGAGLIVLAAYLVAEEASMIVWCAFSMFLMAAVAGFLMLRVYLQRRPLPSGMIVVHAMLAAMGILFLASFLYARSVIDEPAEVRRDYLEASDLPASDPPAADPR